MLREEGKLYTAVVPSPKAKRLLAELEESLATLPASAESSDDLGFLLCSMVTMRARYSAL